MLKALSALSVASAVAAAPAEIAQYSRTVSYAGQQVLNCEVTQGHLREFDDLVNAFNLDVWGSSRPGSLDIHVINNDIAKRVDQYFKGKCVPIIPDLEKNVREWEASYAAAAAAKKSAGNNNDDWFTEYHRYAETVEWWRTLANENTGVVSFNPSIGTSIEGRDLPAVRVSADATKKPAFYLQCQIHAREWISGATCQYIVNKLVEDFNAGDATARDILTTSEIHIVPFVNPDGYEYTWTDARLHRKNRKDTGCFLAPILPDGVDLNRNYPDHWGQGGSSTDPCSETYMGTSAGSEPEVQATMDYFRTLTPVIGGIDMHAYSQLILRPNGWTTEDSPDETRLFNLGADMAAAIRSQSGLAYQNIKSVELYITTGGASDWFYGNATGTNGGFRAASYTLELRPATAFPGFELPPDQIIPSGEEVYEAFKVYLTDVAAAPLRA